MEAELCSLVERVYEHYKMYLSPDGEGLSLIDPVDNRVIGFHYGETHLGVAYIIYGQKYHRKDVEETGIKIIQSFIRHADEYQKEPSYHWDFNNFALCYLVEYLGKSGTLEAFAEEVKKFILKQKDSNNITINWQPMRVYVNHKKYEWTGNTKYLNVVDKCRGDIEKAQYDDGFFEDLLPKGKSFNFQYHMYTTATLAFLSIRGIKIANLERAISEAIAIMDPCGDINYLGRGNNQIFAWGPAIYLYSLLPDLSLEKRALDYIYNRACMAIDNNNLILNDYQGDQKIWWWDYHYASVYIGHFAFWIALTLCESGRVSTQILDVVPKDSGVHIYNMPKGYVVTFDGRKHYLAESGKVIANITTSDKFTYFKGAFGPYYKEYGFKYGNPIATVHNAIGLISEKNIRGKLVQKPVFPIEIMVEEDLNITLKYKRTHKGVRVNIPWWGEKAPEVEDKNGKKIYLCKVLEYRGPYGDTPLYQSRIMDIKEFTIKTQL